MCIHIRIHIYIYIYRCTSLYTYIDTYINITYIHTYVYMHTLTDCKASLNRAIHVRSEAFLVGDIRLFMRIRSQGGYGGFLDSRWGFAGVGFVKTL